MFIFQNNKTRK